MQYLFYIQVLKPPIGVWSVLFLTELGSEHSPSLIIVCLLPQMTVPSVYQMPVPHRCQHSSVLAHGMLTMIFNIS